MLLSTFGSGGQSGGTSARRAKVTAFELETPAVTNRRAKVTAFELEAPVAARRAKVTAFELEVPVITNRRVKVTAFELETPSDARKAKVTAFELETTSAARKAKVTAFELELPGLGGEDFPNEPDGYTLVTERPFTDYEEDGWGNNGTGNYVVPHTDSGGPFSPPNVGRARFGVGRSGGTAPMNTFLESWSIAYASIYVAFGFKVSSNWQGHSSGVNKIMFIVAADYGSGASEPVYLSAQGQDMNTLNFQVRLQGPGNETSQGAGDNLGQTEGGGTITRGAWSKIEMQFIANTGTNFDGECRVWMDGTLTHEYTDIKFFDDAADASNHKFTTIKWNPIWGGNGDEVEETMFQYIDHIYVSGA